MGLFLKMPPPPKEENEQRQLARWLDYRGLLWCHVPNGEKRDKPTASKLKSMGVKPGVPDVIIFEPPPRYPAIKGVAIELKRLKGGHITAEQGKWLLALGERGWMAQVCYGAPEAIAWLVKLGY